MEFKILLLMMSNFIDLEEKKSFRKGKKNKIKDQR